MSANTLSVSATSVALIFPSSAFMFNCPNFWDSSFPSAFSLDLIKRIIFSSCLHYQCLGFSLQVELQGQSKEFPPLPAVHSTQVLPISFRLYKSLHSIVLHCLLKSFAFLTIDNHCYLGTICPYVGSKSCIPFS